MAQENTRKALFTGGGAVIAGLLYRLLKGRNAGLFGTTLASIAGGLLGYGTHACFYGRPYNNDHVDISKLKAGDTLNVVFTGAGDGADDKTGRATRLDNAFKGKHAVYFRWNDRDKADAFLRNLPTGVNINSIGYSWGGKTANKFAKDYGVRSNKLVDPVSWTGRELAPNTTVYTPNKRTASDYRYDPSNIIADIGGRWNYRNMPNSVEYYGGHTEGIYPVFEQTGI